MAHGARKSEKASNMGGKGAKSRGPQMTKKSPGFGAKLGKTKPGKGMIEGPNVGFRP